MNPQRISTLVLIFSDVVLALAVWGVAIPIRAAWGTSTIAGVLTTNTIAGVLPVAVWVALRAVLGLYPGYGINAVDELRRESYATLGGPHNSLHVPRLASGSGCVPLRAHSWLFGTPDRCDARAAVGEVEPQEGKALGSWMTRDSRAGKWRSHVPL